MSCCNEKKKPCPDPYRGPIFTPTPSPPLPPPATDHGPGPACRLPDGRPGNIDPATGSCAEQLEERLGGSVEWCKTRVECAGNPRVCILTTKCRKIAIARSAGGGVGQLAAAADETGQTLPPPGPGLRWVCKTVSAGPPTVTECREIPLSIPPPPGYG